MGRCSCGGNWNRQVLREEREKESEKKKRWENMGRRLWWKRWVLGLFMNERWR